MLRVLKFAFQDIARNLGLSLMTIFILVLMLLSLNTLWSVEVLTKEAVAVTKQQVSLSLYLAPEAEAPEEEEPPVEGACLQVRIIFDFRSPSE